MEIDYVVKDIPVKAVRFVKNPDGSLLNPRGEHWQAVDLSASVEAVGGFNDPIEVYMWADTGDSGETLDPVYYVIDGHRRVTAARALNLETIPAIIKPMPETDADLHLIMVTKSVRQNIDPVSTAVALQRICKDKGWAIERAANAAGVKLWAARIMMNILDETPAMQARIRSGDVSLEAYRALQDKPASVKKQVLESTPEGERLTVRKARQAAKELMGLDKGAGEIDNLFAMLEDAATAKALELITSLAALLPSIPMNDWDRVVTAIENLIDKKEAE